MQLYYDIIQTGLVCCVITFGWATMFNLPSKYIKYSILLTLLAYGLRSLLLELDFHLAGATFFASMLASFTGVYYSRRHSVTPKALIVPSLICLMPGLVAYKAMVIMVQIGYFGFDMELFAQMMGYSIEAVFITTSLVLGLSIPSTVFYRRKPIV